VARLQLRICGAAFVVLATSIPAYAHHGNAGYDLDKTVTLAGTVTGFDWVNPHCLVYVDVKENDGQVQHWTLELASPFTMSHAGWTKSSLMVGDMVVVETHPARNGTTLGVSVTSKSVMKFVVNGKPISAT
jgi:Family of unknown function (DUF6152)